ncbi:cupin domain-containing protein [Thioclava sp. BHET1]|uniref:Cupin n=1 Tax=Thioclava dalianensis TaxID=1185766 RepID=A0A074TQT4_9RHOB|nr:cupin domain-containing protein [Thioclava dalianensis]KEP71313.1 cupin [Thioclava dalianensis]TMV90806.1 cupin domain-containing protein [Thioclava sp. BHET1]SFM77089.1 hypothetical protein SAMN05216224_101223 [Thioclava dalianensis]
MAYLVVIKTAYDTAPREAEAAPDRLIEGAPRFKTWDIDRALNEAGHYGDVRTGLWEATPGTTRSIKGESFEFCHVLSGRCEISEEGGETHRFGPGDSFVLKPGFRGLWKTLETMRKIFVIAS